MLVHFFLKKAFFEGEIPEEIVRIENRIVEKGKGLPLGANVLGGLLCNKEKHEWQAILDGNPLLQVKMITKKIAQGKY